jgi:hypothetical protein
VDRRLASCEQPRPVNERKNDMDDDYEVVYLDDDERNAVVSPTRTQSRHAHSGGGRPVPSILGGSRRPQIVRPSASSGRYYDGRPRQVVVHQSAPRRGFGGLNTGELIEMAAFILAAIQPLPPSPTAQGHTETDVENLVIYQSALATHAKRDEQLRTLGGLLARLLK